MASPSSQLTGQVDELAVFSAPRGRPAAAAPLVLQRRSTRPGLGQSAGVHWSMAGRAVALPASLPRSPPGPPQRARAARRATLYAQPRGSSLAPAALLASFSPPALPSPASPPASATSVASWALSVPTTLRRWRLTSALLLRALARLWLTPQTPLWSVPSARSAVASSPSA